MANTNRQQTLKGTATFFGLGQGYGRLRAQDSTPADTEGDAVPTPETGARKLLRQKIQAVIDDDAADDPDEMEGDDAVAQARVREQMRCAAICGCAAAKGRKSYAMHLAFNTRLTRQQAIDLLARPPMEAIAGFGGYQAAIDAGWDNVNRPNAEASRRIQDESMRRARGETAARTSDAADDPHGWDSAVGRVAGQDTKRKH